jgi:hypothetical protein
MLNGQLDELGNSFLRKRQLEQEKEYHEGEVRSQQMRTQADIDFRKAQGEHYNAMESKEDNRNTLLQKQGDERNQLLEKQVGLKQAAQDMSDAQQSLKDSMATLAHQVKTGKMTQEDATTYFRDSMDNGIGKQNPDMHDKMLASPQFKAMYDGKVDWAILADQLAQQTKSRSVTGANDMLVQHWRQAQDEADAETDPNEKARLQSLADTYKGLIGKQSAGYVPPSVTQTTVTQKPNPLGVGAPISTTNTMNRAYLPSSAPASAATPAAAVAPAGQIPIAPPDPAQRVKGQKYRSQKNPSLTATWTGAGWDTGAPQQQVPGFGSAQP